MHRLIRPPFPIPHRHQYPAASGTNCLQFTSVIILLRRLFGQFTQIHSSLFQCVVALYC